MNQNCIMLLVAYLRIHISIQGNIWNIENEERTLAKIKEMMLKMEKKNIDYLWRRDNDYIYE